jgi:hypothetical protein
MKSTSLKMGIVSALACTGLIGASSAVASPEGSGSDYAFNAMIQEMAGTDTGSQWFDVYVETLNQEIALKAHEEPFGAAGPAGPVGGFDGYLGGFLNPDIGSAMFNAYVRSVGITLRVKEQRGEWR